MFTRTALFALVAAAVVGLAASAAPTVALAKGVGGGHGGSHGLSHMSHGSHNIRFVHRGPTIRIGHHRPGNLIKIGHRHFRHHHIHRFVRWHRFGSWPVYASYGYRTPVSYRAVPIASNCNCLSKRYEDGVVIFEDKCTQESASSEPENENENQAQAQ